MAFEANRYYLYEELCGLLRTYREDYPDLVGLESIGQSPEGRHIWVMTISRSEQAESKPAYWIDANTHASEITGSSTALYTIEFLLKNQDLADVRNLLNHFTFYICPRLNPDGAEYCMQENIYVRSAARNYPDSDAIPTFYRQDLTGDNRVLHMRWLAENGAWCVSEKDPRMMVPRDPWSKGPFYHVSLEGLFDESVLDDPALPQDNVHPFDLDFNRNYPYAWRHDELGAGSYPLSEPETRAVVDFLLAHKNIGGMLTHHTYSGVILRPFTDKNDNEMPPFDLGVYKLIGDRGEALTGYPCLSVFHDFRYDSKKSIGGVFDDWAYEHYGVHCYTMELWDPIQRAGIDISKGYLNFWFEFSEENNLKLLAWNDGELEGKAFLDWQSFDHPQLGEVEIGGWDWMYSTRNPPPKLLEETSKKGCDFALAHAACLPKPAMEMKVSTLEGNIRKVDLYLKNDGFLPTYICDLAKTQKCVHPTTLELELDAGLTLVEGKQKQRVEHLDGIFNRNIPRNSAIYISGSGDHSRRKLTFIVQIEPGAEKGAQLHFIWYGDRIGELHLARDISSFS